MRRDRCRGICRDDRFHLHVSRVAPRLSADIRVRQSAEILWALIPIAIVLATAIPAVRTIVFAGEQQHHIGDGIGIGGARGKDSPVAAPPISRCSRIFSIFDFPNLTALGVSEATAKQNALNIYNINYQQRGKIGGMQAAYYSDQCAPGKAMDEYLSDSRWATP